jgi:hypothetical protein
MKERDFIPFVKYDLIEFGMSFTDVRKLLNAPYSEWRFDATSVTFSDYFDTLGFKIEYDKENKVLAIETFNNMKKPVYFMSKNLTAMTYAQLKRFFKKIDPDIAPFSIGFHSEKFEISVCYSSFEEEPNGKTDSFHLRRKDYVAVMDGL